MLRLISFILALGGLAVSVLGIWLMMGNELPTHLFAGEEPKLERKLVKRDAPPPATEPIVAAAEPEAVAEPEAEFEAHSSTPPAPIPAPVAEQAPPLLEPITEAASEPVELMEEAFESVDVPLMDASPEPVRVMPTPKKDVTTGTTMRSLPGGDIEVTAPGSAPQPAAIEQPITGDAPPEEDAVFETTSTVSTPADMAPASTPPTLQEQLRRAPIAYETPASAMFNSPFTVTLSLNAQEGATSATGGLSGADNMNIAETEILVTDLVRADLIGLNDAFEIVAENEKPQKLSSSTESVWRWEVTPLKSGPQLLRFEIIAVNPNNIEERLETFDDEVTVEVSRIGQAMFLAQQYNPIVVILAGFGSLLAGIFGVLRFFKS